MVYCSQAISYNSTVIFYCDSMCDIADTTYYYKVNVSYVAVQWITFHQVYDHVVYFLPPPPTVTQNEYWCDTNRAIAEANLPSSLLANDPLATQPLTPWYTNTTESGTNETSPTLMTSSTSMTISSTTSATPTLFVIMAVSLIATIFLYPHKCVSLTNSVFFQHSCHAYRVLSIL